MARIVITEFIDERALPALRARHDVLYDAKLVTRTKQGTSAIYSISEPMVFELCKLACEKLNRPAEKPKKLTF